MIQSYFICIKFYLYGSYILTLIQIQLEISMLKMLKMKRRVNQLLDWIQISW